MLPQSLRKTEWTVPEAQEWMAKYKEHALWKGLFLYQGSDSLRHHFITRVVDDFVRINIKRDELKVPEEHSYSSASGAPFGYYYVDPMQNFARVKEYQTR